MTNRSAYRIFRYIKEEKIQKILGNINDYRSRGSDYNELVRKLRQRIIELRNNY